MRRRKRKLITIHDKRIEWFKEILEHILMDHVFLDRIKVTKKISEQWDYVSFYYKSPYLKDLKEDQKGAI